jgi:hypothetical protein
MSKHTKTEWIQPINVDFLHEIHAKDDSNPFNPGATKIVARVEKYRHVDEKSEAHKQLTEEWQANARLITAAPKLFSALENLVNLISLDDATDSAETPFTKAVKEAKELLAKLNG